MRLHRLEMVAFGPFATPVSVDFDALSDAGLFLLTGATGAGKTSVLDAVSFALYGAVPGDRQRAKRLRSDHAAPVVAPEVTLELTVAGRRLRVARSPAWERPKRRGTGTTTEQARVLVEERVAGSWQSLATRLDEAGHLVAGLLGMNLTQFCQVQMLPQGRFQAFLRADSAERHDLLQKLFRTARFEAVEAWLRDHRRRLRRETGLLHDRVAGVLSRLSEAAASDLPAAWDLHALAPVDGELEGWSLDLRERARQAGRAQSEEAEQAERADDLARQAQAAGRHLHEQQQRLARARLEHQELLAGQHAHRDRIERLDRARRAAAVRPLLGAADRARAAAATAAGRAQRAVKEASGLLGIDDPGEADLRDQRRRAATLAADARAMVPLVTEREELLGALAGARTEAAEIEDELDRLDGRLTELPGLVSTARATERGIERASERLPPARREAAEATMRLEAGHLVGELVAERRRARRRLQAAVDAAQSLKERWLDVQERRLTGMAAEIAGGLAVGACCPVCGSAEHPSPAHPTPDAPDAAVEREARRAHDDAEVERHARDGVLRDLDTRIGHARERAGHRTVPVLTRQAAEAGALVTRLESTAGERAAATAARQRAEQEQVDTSARRTELVARQASLETTREDRLRRVESITRDVERLLAGTGACSVAELAERMAVAERACDAAIGAVEDRRRADQSAHDSDELVHAAVVDAGFDSIGDLRGALVGEVDVAELDATVQDHDRRLATVSAVLEDPGLAGLDDVAAPDLPALEEAVVATEARLAAARARAARAGERRERLERLHGDLVAAVSAWLPATEDLDLADRLSSLVDGSSPDNRLRMRLSGYVLAFRLRQVVAAANERLVRMTDARYRLEHTGDRGAGETRGGLSLLVNDDWTGQPRDPMTLSGGETFVVSLALALGLADVITFEAGGVELDTLFVDEGFGTLDAETLDQVMDMLDSLRDGGRVVGVVSHVAELRDRIPAQLHVRKLRTGSAITQGGVG